MEGESLIRALLREPMIKLHNLIMPIMGLRIHCWQCVCGEIEPENEEKKFTIT